MAKVELSFVHNDVAMTTRVRPVHNIAAERYFGVGTQTLLGDNPAIEVIAFLCWATTTPMVGVMPVEAMRGQFGEWLELFEFDETGEADAGVPAVPLAGTPVDGSVP